jgi:hypothetical protein
MSHVIKFKLTTDFFFWPAPPIILGKLGLSKTKLTLAKRCPVTIYIYIYRVSILKVEHRQLTLCIQFIGIMLLFL